MDQVSPRQGNEKGKVIENKVISLIFGFFLAVFVVV